MTRHIPTINAVDADSIQDYSYVQAEMGETFGQALARYMNELKIDTASLSASTGISKASIYYYTKNKRRVSFNHIAAICIALRLHPLRSRYLFALAHYHLSAQCEMLNLSRTKVYELIKNGEIKRIPCGRIIKVAKVTVIDFVLQSAQ